MPIHLESIGDGAFQNCSSLEYIVLPNTLSHIGQFAFSGCENLKFIIVSRPRKSYFEYLLPDNKEKLVEIDYEMEALETNDTEEIPNIWIDEYGAIYSADKRIFLKCPNIERYCIKEGAVVIAEEAFGECTKLMFLYIPSTIQDIKTTAFYRSYSNSIRLSENLSTMSQGYEFSCIQLQSIVIPYENKQKVKSLLPEHLRNILIEQKSGIEELCTKVTQEDWNNVWIDEYGATYSKDQKRLLRCPKVKTYNIVVGTKVIAEQAFKGCAELEEVQIPTSVELIGAQAFDSCWNLEKLEIPNSVKSIGKRCFEGCPSLQEIRIPEGITKIEDRTFEGCYKLQKVLLPDSLHEIGAYVFTICNISEIELPKQLKTIGYNAFWKAGITKLSIPNSVSRIDAGAFWHCSSLETIFLPPSLNEIKDETFFFCSKLSHIELPKSINKIGRSAFDGAKSLKSIVIPEGVTQIEYAAFATCYSLEEIKLPSTISHVGDKVFLDCPKLKKIRVPMGTKEVFTRLIPNYSNKIYEE